MYYNFVNYTSKQLENKSYRLCKEKNRASLDMHIHGAAQYVDTHSAKRVCLVVRCSHVPPRAAQNVSGPLKRTCAQTHAGFSGHSGMAVVKMNDHTKNVIRENFLLI